MLWRQEQIIPELRFCFLGRKRDGGDRGRGVKKGREEKNELERERETGLSFIQVKIYDSQL